MEHEIIETRERIELAGIEVRASNADARPIGTLWGRVREEDLFRDADRIYAVYCEYEGDHTAPYTFFLGRAIEPGEETPAGFVRRTVPAGRFARFVAEGEQPAAMMQTWVGIWNLDLDRRFETDYEIHARTDPTRVEIYVGV